MKQNHDLSASFVIKMILYPFNTFHFDMFKLMFKSIMNFWLFAHSLLHFAFSSGFFIIFCANLFNLLVSYL